ncbi:lmo0937 family membrane protein [Bacillus piscicola]
MLWSLIVLLIIIWLLGLIFKVAGGFIHLLLVIALIVLLIKLFTGRKGP